MRILAACAGIAFAWFVCQKGIPALRQDWNWIPDAASFRLNLLDSVSGWTAYGMGAPRAYPTDYLLDVGLYALSFFFAPGSLLLLVSGIVGYIVATGASMLVAPVSRSVTLHAGFMMVALFNPWTYNEVVAGHLFMILAFGGTLMIAARFAADDWQDYRDWWLLLLTFQQIQFFLIVAAVCLVAFLRKRAWISLATMAIVSLPVIYGVFADVTSLVATPYFVQWQNDQSVAWPHSFLLSGYFTHYSDALGWTGTVAATLLLALVLLSGIVGARSPLWFVGAFGALIIALIVSGTKGPLAVPYVFVVRHVTETGVFRELYDLVAGIIVGYLIMLRQGSGSALLRSGIVAAGLAYVAAWALSPPAQWWVSREAIPTIRRAGERHSRYALFPPFQPLSFDSGGSGADPDLWLRDPGGAPLNEYLPSYPAASALAKAWYFGDSRDLAALSVTNVVCRPWLRMHADALNAQGVGVPMAAPCRKRALRAAPMLQLTRTPPTITVQPASLGEDQVAFWDAKNASGRDVPAAWHSYSSLVPVRPLSQSFDARHAWVSAALITKEKPYWATPLGGAYTAADHVMLSVPKTRWLLVRLHGRLLSGKGRMLSGTTHGYRWIRRENAEQVQCEGQCLVAAGAASVPSAARRQPMVLRRVAFRQYTPWLARMVLKPGGPAMLVYNVQYSPKWTLWPMTGVDAHARVDGIVNGWLLAARSATSYRWIVERTALVQACLEMFAVIWLLGLVVFLFAQRRTGLQCSSASSSQR